LSGNVCVFAPNVATFIKTPTFAIQVIVETVSFIYYLIVFFLQPQYDQWQILHVIGRNFNISSVNQFGKRMVSLLKTKFLHSNYGHGAFVDSCAHHCTSCSDKDEDSWAGPHIISSISAPPSVGNDLIGVNQANAFATWFQSSLATKNESSLSSRLFTQDFSFPCDKCCMCRVYH
jgi:hypothetical protein